ncbi:hypothetical protein FCM35_KLT06661 [Carex littledalei]|uniref:Glyoxalase At5g48480-like N-terminal domain-containing protein n=1 Tax=Carex littledalei TaxID=544730 RepID=A0A833QKI9_9POAL|nr:hypothetical protein FCM35_KLT06661 [Carex littledalei]
MSTKSPAIVNNRNLISLLGPIYRRENRLIRFPPERIKKPLHHLVDLPVGSSPPPPFLSPRSPAKTLSASSLTSVPASKAEEAVNFYKVTFGAEEASRACCSKRKSDQEQLSLLYVESRSETPL